MRSRCPRASVDAGIWSSRPNTADSLSVESEEAKTAAITSSASLVLEEVTAECTNAVRSECEVVLSASAECEAIPDVTTSSIKLRRSSLSMNESRSGKARNTGVILEVAEGARRLVTSDANSRHPSYFWNVEQSRPANVSAVSTFLPAAFALMMLSTAGCESKDCPFSDTFSALGCVTAHMGNQSLKVRASKCHT